MTKSKKSNVNKSFNTIKAMVFDYFDKLGQNDIDHDHLVKMAKVIKPDTKYNKYHTSYWKSKYKSVKNASKVKSEVKSK